MQHDNPIMKDYLQAIHPVNQMNKRNFLWRSMVRASVYDEDNLRKNIQRELKKRFLLVAEIVNKSGTAAALNWITRNMYDDTILDPLFSSYKTIGLKYAKMMYRKVIAEASNMNHIKVINQQKAANSFGKIWEDAIVSYLRLHGVKFVSDINETTRKDILRILAEGDESNWTQRQIIDALLSQGMHHNRAARIARTETTRAMNAGILIAATSIPFEVYKQWITAEDEVVRTKPFSHTQLHGKTLPLEEAFNNGEDIRFPGDPIASAENVINCRCLLDIKPRMDQFGRPIPRIVNPFDMDILRNI